MLFWTAVETGDKPDVSGVDSLDKNEVGIEPHAVTVFESKDTLHRQRCVNEFLSIAVGEIRVVREVLLNVEGGGSTLEDQSTAVSCRVAASA